MPIYDFYCNDCDYKAERYVTTSNTIIICPKCGGFPLLKRPGGNIMVKMKGEGGYPSRRKQIFNTTKRKHPKLD